MSEVAGETGKSRLLVRLVERDGDVVELEASTPSGTIRAITRLIRDGDDLILSGFHIDGQGAGSSGLRLLRELAKDLGRQHGALRVIIFGGVRTTGANPGRFPRSIVIPVGDA